ncbi:hypothetical protein GALMADRAFT_256098 [Galerina marginata CBS 339.88]|uniref:Uncharacterized protein n=1 Tax=Galerina marginata (strain CBS 339.88) TaxID=685588 RepID=A0A067SR38_GALM3|nr:hypothetical protein GALMADRAFT_256098 [Galerina marginata CBS 339.88]
MRWSLIVPTFLVVEFALSFVSVALPVPRLSHRLERRALNAKAHSKAYRASAAAHPNLYAFDDHGGVTLKKLPRHKRLPQGQKLLRVPMLDADHIYEHQMLKKNLENNGLRWGLLSHGLQNKAKTILIDQEGWR